MKPSYIESMLSDGGSSGFKPEFLTTNKKWSLLGKLYESYDSSSTEVNIPKKLHQVWLGSEIPEGYKRLSKTWTDLHPDWEYKLWTDVDLHVFGLDKNEHYLSLQNYGMKSDILRYYILKEYGGVYADTDFICVKNITPLLKYDFFGCGGPATMENSEPEIFNGLFGSIPNHPILIEAVESFSKPIEKVTNIIEQSGPKFFTRIIFNKINEDSSAVILPLSYFYPLPAVARFAKTNPFSWVKPESYGIHLWESSWQ